ncbi:MAG: hypothetical protein XD82_0070, partial [Methanoculleus marisnigri]
AAGTEPDPTISTFTGRAPARRWISSVIASSSPVSPVPVLAESDLTGPARSSDARPPESGAL